WDTSHPCQAPCTSGSANIRKSSETVTLPRPTGSITKQTQYTYSGLAISLPVTIKEWNYGAANPTRTTAITYLSDNNPSVYGPSGRNIIDRPASIVVTDASSNKLSET